MLLQLRKAASRACKGGAQRCARARALSVEQQQRLHCPDYLEILRLSSTCLLVQSRGKAVIAADWFTAPKRNKITENYKV